jgi:hypothetical protein
MVLPTTPEQTAEEQPGVRILRSEDGVFYGFQDPVNGQFISRADALSRLTYSVEQGALQDSFGNTAGVGSVALPGRGVTVTYATAEAEYLPMQVDPTTFKPESNQEIVERVIFTDQDGNLVTLETSYGLGNDYNPHATGGRWRRGASQALGLDEGERLPTADLERAVIYKEFIVKTTSS